MTSASTGTAIEALSANVLSARFEDFDRATLDKAKCRVIDVIGCVIGGANAGGNAGLLELVRRWGGSAEATVLVHGDRAPTHNAAMVNSVMARSFDFEPLMPLVGGRSVPAHLSGTTVTTALAMGEATGADGKEFLTALLVGDDVASRVHAATRGDHFSLGWTSVGTVNMIGATAIAGRLLRLDVRQVKHAFGITLNQLCGNSIQSIWDGATTFKLHQGVSARNGIFSAELARAGWAGVDDALLSRYGYYHFYGGCGNPAILTDGLGKIYYQDSTFKRYPTCAATHPALDSAFALMAAHDFAAAAITHVAIRLPRAALDGFCNKPFRFGDFPHAAAVYSHQYTLASTLVRKSVKLEHFLDEAIRDPEVNALVPKITIEELPGAATGAEVSIRLDDGREITHYTRTAKGTPGDPITKDDVVAKYWTNVEFSRTVSDANAKALLTVLEQLEDVDRVARVAELTIAGRR